MFYFIKKWYIKSKGWKENTKHKCFLREIDDMLFIYPINTARRTSLFKMNAVRLVYIMAMSSILTKRLDGHIYCFITLERDKVSNDVLETIASRIGDDYESSGYKIERM
jgi:hypothetical protein